MFDISLSKLLREKTAENPNQEFMVYSDRDLRFSYAQFDKRVDDMAAGLYAIGVRKGDNVGIWATNVPDWLTYMFACARLGAVAVTVNTSYKLHELEYLVRQADLTTLCLTDGVKDSNYVQMIKELVPELDEYEREDFCNPNYNYILSKIIDRTRLTDNEKINILINYLTLSKEELFKKRYVDDKKNTIYNGILIQYPFELILNIKGIPHLFKTGGIHSVVGKSLFFDKSFFLI
jgi:acyl-CoA synthetase (AMP-forming)/AMP-acid ligase II